MNKKKILKNLSEIENISKGELSKNENENDLFAILDLFEAYVVSKAENIREDDMAVLNKSLLKKWFEQINSLVNKITLTKLKKNRSLYKRYVACKNFLGIYFEG